MFKVQDWGEEPLNFRTLNFEPELAFFHRHERPGLRADVIGVGSDEPIVGALLDDMRRPASDSRDDEQRREHGRRDAAKMIGAGAVKIEIRKHLLFPAHDLFKKMGNLGLLGLTYPEKYGGGGVCLLYTSPSPRDA